jgi:hypothetical protein
MSTRSRTRAAAAAASAPVVAAAPTSKVKGKAAKATPTDGQTEKENDRYHTNAKVDGKARQSAAKLYCLCRKGDDGSPMVLCSECQDWSAIF